MTLTIGVGGANGGGKSLGNGSQSFVVVGLRGLDELQLSLQLGYVGEEVPPHYLCQGLCYTHNGWWYKTRNAVLPNVTLTSVNSSSSSAVFGGPFLVEEVEAVTTAPA